MEKLYIIDMKEERDNLVYDRFIKPVKLHYYGYTDDVDRRKQRGYKSTALQQYIDEYGWDSISTIILADGLTKKEAEQLENKLIKEGWKRGDCINQRGSGGEWRDNPVECNKQYHKQYRETHKEEIKQHMKQLNSTPAGKIYNRVNVYNYRHQDRMIITPLEAKEMYELTGYIPDFIKITI